MISPDTCLFDGNVRALPHKMTINFDVHGKYDPPVLSACCRLGDGVPVAWCGMMFDTRTLLVSADLRRWMCAPLTARDICPKVHQFIPHKVRRSLDTLAMAVRSRCTGHLLTDR
jgi:hypothetical protein